MSLVKNPEIKDILVDRKRLPPAETAILDPNTKKEVQADKKEQKLHNQRKHLENNSLRDDVRLKKHYGYAILIGIFVWLLLVLVTVCLTGLQKLYLSDSVLVTLLSTTTVNLIGVLWVVVKYLFPH